MRVKFSAEPPPPHPLFLKQRLQVGMHLRAFNVANLLSGSPQVRFQLDGALLTKLYHRPPAQFLVYLLLIIALAHIVGTSLPGF